MRELTHVILAPTRPIRTPMIGKITANTRFVEAGDYDPVSAA